MNNLTSVLTHLEQERTRLSSQLEALNKALSALGSTTHHGARRISAAGRARIAAAQRARWAKAQGNKVVSIAPRKRRKMSATAIARIRAAQKARWAKWRKQQKKTA
jgi:hypothetical protein